MNKFDSIFSHDSFSKSFIVQEDLSTTISLSTSSSALHNSIFTLSKKSSRQNFYDKKENTRNNKHINSCSVSFNTCNNYNSIFNKTEVNKLKMQSLIKLKPVDSIEVRNIVERTIKQYSNKKIQNK